MYKVIRYQLERSNYRAKEFKSSTLKTKGRRLKFFSFLMSQTNTIGTANELEIGVI